MIGKLFIVLILIRGLVFANSLIQENNNIELREPKVIPIWIGNYFTGKIVVINEVGQKYWCELDKELMDYKCKLLGGN